MSDTAFNAVSNVEKQIAMFSFSEQIRIMAYVANLIKQNAEEKEAKKDTSFIDAMQGVLSHEDVEAIRATHHLKFKEV